MVPEALPPAEVAGTGTVMVVLGVDWAREGPEKRIRVIQPRVGRIRIGSTFYKGRLIAKSNGRVRHGVLTFNAPLPI